MRALVVTATALLALTGAGAASAQAVAGAVGQDYRVGAGDVLRIAAFQSPELSLDVQVSESGKISYPLVGVVDVSGQTPFQITPGITVGQALAVAGGVTPRGAEGNIDVFRVAADGRRTKVSASRADIVRPGDEIVIHERIF